MWYDNTEVKKMITRNYVLVKPNYFTNYDGTKKLVSLKAAVVNEYGSLEKEKTWSILENMFSVDCLQDISVYNNSVIMTMKDFRSDFYLFVMGSAGYSVIFYSNFDIELISKNYNDKKPETFFSPLYPVYSLENTKRVLEKKEGLEEEQRERYQNLIEIMEEEFKGK